MYWGLDCMDVGMFTNGFNIAVEAVACSCLNSWPQTLITLRAGDFPL